MSRDTHKKMYYVPGLVSLILVPVLITYFGRKEEQKLNKAVIEVNAWHPDLQSYFPLPERNFRQFQLTGNRNKDTNEIENARLLIKQIYTREDTVSGVHFILQDSVTYATFVNILNFFRADSIRYYAIYSNNIWVLNLPKPKVREGEVYFVCGNLSNDIIYYQDAETNIFQDFYNNIKPYFPSIKKLWLPITLLFTLLLLSTLRIINYSTRAPYPST